MDILKLLLNIFPDAGIQILLAMFFGLLFFLILKKRKVNWVVYAYVVVSITIIAGLIDIDHIIVAMLFSLPLTIDTITNLPYLTNETSGAALYKLWHPVFVLLAMIFLVYSLNKYTKSKDIRYPYYISLCLVIMIYGLYDYIYSRIFAVW